MIRSALTFVLVALVSIGAVHESPLVAAARNGDLEALRKALKPGVDVNQPEADGSVALHWAVHRDRLEAAELLIQSGANANAVNRYGVTPLSLAALNGSVAIVKVLLRAGANPNVSLLGGETPLMTASRAGSPEVVQALVAGGANVNARETTRGQTALMWAAAEGHVATIKALLAAGADIRARATGLSVAKETPSDASSRDNSQLRGLLLFSGMKGPRLDTFTPFMFAIRNGRSDAAAALVDAGANVNELGPSAISALEIAIANANYDVAAWLLDKGANPNVAENGWTALHRLARTRKPNSGFVPGPMETSSITSLDLAKKLIAKGAAVNAQQTKLVDDGYRQQQRIGATPFWLAVKYADLELMRLLLEHGADPTIAVANGTTTLMAAAGIGTINVGEDTGPPDDTFEAVRICFERVGGVNAANQNGDTALHGAARLGFNPVVEFLVAHGAKLDVKNKKGQTPLAVAEADEDLARTAKLLRDLMERAKTANGGRP